MNKLFPIATVKFCFCLLVLFTGLSYTANAQINIVYKDSEADTLKLFENKKILIEQLNQKVEQNQIKIGRLDSITQSLIKKNDSLSFGIHSIKRELDSLVRKQAVARETQVANIIEPKVVNTKPVVKRKKAMVIPVVAPITPPISTSSEVWVKIDSLNAANARFVEQIKVLQETVSTQKITAENKVAAPVAPLESDHSHLLIYIIMGILGVGVVVLFFRNSL